MPSDSRRPQRSGRGGRINLHQKGDVKQTGQTRNQTHPLSHVQEPACPLGASVDFFFFPLSSPPNHRLPSGHFKAAIKNAPSSLSLRRRERPRRLNCGSPAVTNQTARSHFMKSSRSVPSSPPVLSSVRGESGSGWKLLCCRLPRLRGLLSR